VCAAGEVLLFEYRTLHHGGANTSDAMRPVAYVLYAASGARDTHNFPSSSLRDYCKSFRERNARLDERLAQLRTCTQREAAR
jgi:ectoine hydroxylase-related dioxygenase (phytanoyl-CoA dioxygenase family)